MIDFDTALAALLDAAGPMSATDTLPPARAAGRVLAMPVVARLASPRSDVAIRDGYALRRADIAAGAVLRIVGEAAAGGVGAPAVGPGEAARIFTGAHIPKGADHVLMQEDVAIDGAMVRITNAADPEPYIRRVGSDFSAGDTLITAGTRLTARHAVLAAAADYAAVAVIRRPRVAIVATGDELAAPGRAAADLLHIPDSVTSGLAACVMAWGGEVVSAQTLGDDLPILTAAAGAALNQTEILVISGGASVGDRDFAKPMVDPHGLSLIFSTVAIKPGKPVWAGRANGRMVLGLPGNPTSAMVTARLFLQPLIAQLAGETSARGLPWRNLPLAAPIPDTGGRETFLRAMWQAEGLRAVSNQDSGAQGALAEADWLIRCPAGQGGVAAGEMVRALAL
jgi:molybdopterin molybdotransferase